MSYNRNLDYLIAVVQKHADELYALVSKCNPDGNMFRGETEQDKNIGSAVWHAHEIVKYLAGIKYRHENLVNGK